MKKIAVITGGATGIGKACANLFVERGWKVYIVSRSENKLRQLQAILDVEVIVADASKIEEWQNKILHQIHQNNEKIDCLIASAGTMSVGSLSNLSIDDWQIAIQNNLYSAISSAKAVMPDLIQQQGNIVFIASIASLAAGPEACAYTTSKHALIGLMKSIARDYGNKNVRSNAICPGWVKTPMADEEMGPIMDFYHLSLDEAYAKVTQNVPLQRVATPDEIAHIAYFLSGKSAAIITGSTIVADGGASIVDVPTLAFSPI